MSYSTVLCCGSGSTGLLFQPTNKDYSSLQSLIFPYKLKSISTSGTISASIDSNSNCYIWKDNIYRLLAIKVTQVSCGWTHVLLLTSGNVYAYGKGNHGQLGLGNCKEVEDPVALNIAQAVSVHCGFRSSFVVLELGFCAFGENSGFQLGFGHKQHVVEPTRNDNVAEVECIRSGNKHCIAFHQNLLYVWGTNNFGQLGIPEKIQPTCRKIEFSLKIKKICCGWNHSVVLLENGSLLMSGKGKMGQQGNGKNEDQYEFSEVTQGVDDVESATENVFVLKNGDLYGWGWNEHGNLATGDKVDRNEPTFIMSQVKSVYCGGAVSYFCLI